MEDNNKNSNQQPTIFHERYELKRLLGRGNFSEVWLVDDVKTHTEVALKIYAPGTGLDDTGLDIFAREFAIVLNANHENILRPLHYDVCDRRPYLILPFCANGSTQRRVGMMTEKDAWKLLHDVASALAFLHTMKPPIIHQDIKPDNLLISDGGDYMLTDFGVSSHCRSVLRKSVSSNFKSAGTTAYMAPERFGRESGTPIMASDIYSLAATTFELLTGDVPFGNDGGLRQKKGADVPDLPEKFSPQLRKVVRLCLAAEPWGRPSASELAGYATHGMKGERFLVKGEKSFVRRFWPLLLVVGLALGGGCFYAVNRYVSAQQEQQEQNESLRRKQALDKETRAIDAASASLKNATQLLRQAGSNDDRAEGFDQILIQAHNECVSALIKVEGYKNAAPLRKKLTDLQQKVDEQLRLALDYLREKVELFNDDPESRKEFELRVKHVEEALNN